MVIESKINLPCPYCDQSIYQNIDWFKKSYSTCPACEQGLVASQFTAVIADLEQAMDEHIEEMIHGAPQGGCCGGGGGKSGCGCSH